MQEEAKITLVHKDGALGLSLGGRWRMGGKLPAQAAEAKKLLANPRVQSLHITVEALDSWDTSLLVFLVDIVRQARGRRLPVDSADLPEGIRRLLDLAFAVPPREGSQRVREKRSFLGSLGGAVLGIPAALHNALDFVGEVTLSLGRLLRGRADMRRQDFLDAVQECGVDALPIVSLTSALFGLILAFVGAVQLMQFGAQIYVAGLVGIGMLRVMGAVMVGVVMAGRMGAAYAALIGTMQVNEEVDALATFGLSPLDFLVLPRLLALSFMVPLLTLYADFMGMLGGFLVGVTMLGLHPFEYITATMNMVPFRHVVIGLVYAAVFGVIIALSGCYQGMRCGRSAAAVGMATTAAVVNALVGIIVATALITVLCNLLDV